MALTDNLVSYWKLDESSGNAADSVSSNTLTNNNTITYSTGKINNGASLQSASNQYFSISDAAQSGLEPTDMSISAWIKVTSDTGNDPVIVSKDVDTAGRQYDFQFDSATDCIALAVFSNNASVTQLKGTTALSTGTWYHVATTYDYVSDGNSIIVLYLNGTIDGSTNTAKGPIQAGTAFFGVGGRAYSGALSPFNGTIDEVGFWSRVLTSSEIGTLYNSGVGLQYPFAVSSTYRKNNLGLMGVS